MFKDIYNILTVFLGESKQGAYSSDVEQYQFNCCRCAEDNGGIVDNKHNLEVLLSPSKGFKYHCWKCGDTDNMMGNLGSLIKKYGGISLYKSYKEIVEGIRRSKLYDINLFNESENKLDETICLSLPQSYKKIDLNNLQNRTLFNYLKKRGFTQDIIDRYNIGYTEWDDDWTMRNKLIIPSYDKFGDLNFYVGRDFTNKAKLKYKNCDTNKESIIFQESLINWDANVYLVEGAIDCMMIPNSVSLLGKYLSKKSELYQALTKKCNGKIVICLDGDTNINEIKRIYSMLNFGRLRNKIYYVRLGEDDIPYKDFNDIFVSEGKRGIINTIRKMKQFEEIDLIF